MLVKAEIARRVEDVVNCGIGVIPNLLCLSRLRSSHFVGGHRLLQGLFGPFGPFPWVNVNSVCVVEAIPHRCPRGAVELLPARSFTCRRPRSGIGIRIHANNQVLAGSADCFNGLNQATCRMPKREITWTTKPRALKSRTENLLHAIKHMLGANRSPRVLQNFPACPNFGQKSLRTLTPVACHV